MRESDLVAVLMPPGPAWLEALATDAALLPLDHRLPRAEVDAVLARARPTALWDGSTMTRLDGAQAEDGTALVIATGGTAGEQRAACLQRTAVEHAARASIGRLGATAEDAWLSCLPMSHMGGLLVLLRARLLGAPVIFGDLAPGAAFASIVPTQLARALLDGIDLSGFRALVVGGAALDDDAVTRAPVVRTYGLTESCGGVVYDGAPLDGVTVRVSEGGEIQLAGPTLMSGYRLDPDATAGAFTADGWLRTRDAGTWDGARLTVHGRLDDVIVTGGEKVWPDEVERVLLEHPSVADVAVAGRPDAGWGARVVAFVVPDGDPPTLDGLRAFCAERLARHKVPRELILIQAVPRTLIGKVARARLPG